MLLKLFKKIQVFSQAPSFQLVELHLWILLGSFIPSINIFINLSSFEIVFLRTLIAFIILGVSILLSKKKVTVAWKDLMGILLAGLFTSLFWIAFVLAAKEGNASVALVGIATSPLWVSLITPIFGRNKWSFNEVMMGLNAIFGVYMIFSSSFAYSKGMILAIIAAFFAALVTVVNSKYTKKYDHKTITFYQMGGAWLGTVLLAPLYINYINPEYSVSIPTFVDIILIIILAVLFSIFAHSSIIRIMKSISPFTVSLANNLSPIYGGLLALVLFGKKEVMDIYFYAGAIIIIASLMAFPLAQVIFGKKKT